MHGIKIDGEEREKWKIMWIEIDGGGSGMGIEGDNEGRKECS